MANKNDIRKAFDEINKAIIELESARGHIVKLHSTVEEIDNSIETLNRVSHVVEPSSDAHEALFARIEQAKEKLREFDSSGARNKIKKSLDIAYNATSEAYSKIL